MKNERNQELTKLIGRRLRETCASNAAGEFPAAIAAGLAKVRQVEDREVTGEGDAATGDTEADDRQPHPIGVDAACEAPRSGLLDASL